MSATPTPPGGGASAGEAAACPSPAYLRQGAALPYCKGCGHALVLRSLDEALRSLAIAPSDVAVVTDIGCVGLADAQFDQPHTVHTTHGRSTAFATGIALADAALGSRRLKTIVLIGDGGSMIGINHLVFGSVLNPDVTVLVHNNFLFGMTGGQNSAFSPLGFVTSTTRQGNPVPPLDLGQVMLASRAPFVARTFATDRDLAATIARAIAHPGFAVVEVLELCTTLGTRWNALTGSRMKEIAEEAGYAIGVLRDQPRPFPLAQAAEGTGARTPAEVPAVPSRTAHVDDAISARPRFAAAVEQPLRIVLAGTAGERVQSAATILADAALLCGLQATQKNDNPVTQGTGFSLSELILSPREILFTGIERPDIVLACSEDGARELTQAGVFARSTASTLVVADAEVALPACAARVHRAPLRKTAGGKLAAMLAVAWWARDSHAIPMDALWEAMQAKLGDKSAQTHASLVKALESIG